MRRRATAAILGAVMALGLGACSGGGSAASPTAPSSVLKDPPLLCPASGNDGLFQEGQLTQGDTVVYTTIGGQPFYLATSTETFQPEPSWSTGLDLMVSSSLTGTVAVLVNGQIALQQEIQTGTTNLAIPLTSIPAPGSAVAVVGHHLDGVLGLTWTCTPGGEI